MSKRALQLGPKLRLPLDAVTRALCVTGQRGTGKTSSAVVLVEEAAAAGAPSVIIDPTDVWWGLRTSADGKTPGLGHVIFGGPHGHLPLREDAGAVMARLVVEQRLAAVFSIKHLRKGAQLRFVAEFMEELYHLNSEALLVVIDEAHRFAPRVQMEKGGFAQRCLGAVTDIATLGRANGLGIALVTQRLARLHTDVREACEVMIAKRLVGPNDRKAIEEWLADAGAEEEVAHLRAILPKVPLEQALVYAPGLDILGEFVIRMKRTFDSSGTPEVGARALEPVAAADIDLSAIEAQIGETIERAKEDDPKALRERVRQLERELAEPRVEIVEGPIPAEDIALILTRLEGAAIEGDLLLKGAREARSVLEGIGETLAILTEKAVDAMRYIQQGLDIARTHGANIDPDLLKAVGLQHVPAYQPHERSLPPAPARTPVPTPAPRPAPPAPRSAPESNGSSGSVNGTVTPARQRILDALAALEAIGVQQASKNQLALFAKVSPKSSGYANNLGALRSGGLIDYPAGGMVALTSDGRAVADGREVPTSQDALLAYVRQLVGPSKGRIIDALVESYPAPLTKAELADAVAVSAASSGYANNLGNLRSLGLIAYPQPGYVQATELLFPA